MGKIIKKRVEYGGSSNSAENIKYDDTKNVKEAINEVNSNLEKASQTKRLSNVSVLSVVKNGKYYVGGAMDIPNGSSSFGYLDVHVYDDNDTNRKITWTPVNSNVTYTNIKEGDTWLGWDSFALNSSFVSSDQGTLAGLIKNGQMWLIIAQRITVPDSAMFIAHGWNDEVYIKPIYKDSSIDYYVNNQGTITVTYDGDAGNVLISAIRLH